VDHRDRDLRALLEVTRPITLEEMAELQLEQGYADRALSIYDELAEREPANAAYATRRAWLARIVARSPGPRRARRSAPVPTGSLQAAASETGPLQIGQLRIGEEHTLNGLGPKSEEEPALVRRLPIVGVR
jgi:hypothetical protein